MFEQTEIIVLEENNSVLLSLSLPLTPFKNRNKIGMKINGWETSKGVGEGYSFVLKLKQTQKESVEFFSKRHVEAPIHTI